jgi:hypothetical protein
MATVAYFKILSQHLLEELGKVAKILSHNRWTHGWDSNKKLPENKMRV